MTNKERKIIHDLLKKYELFVSNLEWHIRTNQPESSPVIDAQLKAYRQVVIDLKRL